MSITAEEAQTRLEIFRELLNGTGIFYFWRYDRTMKLLETTCPSQDLDRFFEITDGKKYLLDHCADSKAPIILCSSIGLVWFAAMERTETDDGIRAIHLIGPINDAESILIDRKKLMETLRLPPQWERELDRLARSHPMTSIIALEPYTMMLHQCVTGEIIKRGDIRYQKSVQPSCALKVSEKRDRHRIYMMEQAVISNIRNGNLLYQEDWERMSQNATGVRVEGETMLTRGKMSVVTFIGTCTRAAIEGGMTPEAAFTKGDAYLERVMACTTIGDLREANHLMYDDFVHCVYRCRTNPKLSPRIQLCCDYIELHLEEDVSVEQLAQQVGYNKNYLARKFKEETGTSIIDYIRIVKIERAKQLLAYSSASIDEIGANLHFCSRSYFSKVFQQITGATPAEYRKHCQDTKQ